MSEPNHHIDNQEDSPVQNLLEPPIRRPANSRSLGFPPGRMEWSCAYNFSRSVLDTAEFDFHVDIAPDAPAQVAVKHLEMMRNAGYEPLPEEECEAELLDDGWVRIYFTPIFAVDDRPLIPAPRQQGR